jgi:hypothetical protein
VVRKLIKEKNSVVEIVITNHERELKDPNMEESFQRK